MIGTSTTIVILRPLLFIKLIISQKWYNKKTLYVANSLLIIILRTYLLIILSNFSYRCTIVLIVNIL